jgi:hypothetical protein
LFLVPGRQRPTAPAEIESNACDKVKGKLPESGFGMLAESVVFSTKIAKEML